MGRIKRFACLLLCMVLGTTFLPAASATIISGAKVSGDWEYTVSDGEATIVYYNGNFKTNVEIPSKLGGKKVTAIAWGAFGSLPKMQSVTIPDSVTLIEDEAFLNCTALRTVTIGRGAQDVRGNPFDGCTSLETIRLSDNHPYLQLIDGVLFTRDPVRLVCYPANKKQSTYTLPEGVTEIGDSAFSPNSHIKTLVIPSSVTKIHSTAFNTGHGGKKSITLDVTQNAYAKSYAVDKQMKYIENIPQETPIPATAAPAAAYQLPTRDHQYVLDKEYRLGDIMSLQTLTIPLSFMGYSDASLYLEQGSNGVLTVANYYLPSRTSKGTALEDYAQVEAELAKAYADLPTTDGHGGNTSMMLALSAFTGGEISSSRRVDQEYGLGIDHVLMQWGDEYRHFVCYEIFNMESYQQMVPSSNENRQTPTPAPTPTPSPAPTSTPTPAPTETPSEASRVIYDSEWATVSFTEFVYEEKYDKLIVRAVVENKTEQNLTFWMKNAVCNGWSIEEFYYVKVPAKSKSRGEFEFSDFEKSTGLTDVSQIERFRFDLKFYDSSTYKDVQKLTGPFDIDPSLF